MTSALLGYVVVVPSPFGPATDCPNPSTFEEAMAQASKCVREEGPVTIYRDGQPIVFLAGARR